MSNEDMIDAIEQIQDSQNNIKIYTAVPMGILMLVYFFTFANLIDQGLTGLLGFEIVTTILFIWALFSINKISFYLVKLRYRNRKPFCDLIDKLTPKSIGRPARTIYQEIYGNSI